MAQGPHGEDIMSWGDLRPERGKPRASQPVFLNIYRVPNMPNMKRVGLGAWHTGTEIFGREFAFGWHQDSDTGIYNCRPKQAGGFDYHKTIDLGETSLSEQEVEELVHRLEPAWIGNEYDIVARNCNHFSDTLGRALTGKRIPEYLNRLAGLGNGFCELFGVRPDFLYPNGIPEPVCGTLPQLEIDQEDCLDNQDFNQQVLDILARKSNSPPARGRCHSGESLANDPFLDQDPPDESPTAVSGGDLDLLADFDDPFLNKTAAMEDDPFESGFEARGSVPRGCDGAAPEGVESTVWSDLEQLKF
eukprot:TRINITY_DN36531_c0_g2_i1.p1 TRINITY_DN36531_c0_g2~~TRINITY_DN36531_c0_g2_i1.p1  ORF type:complete len:303 (-),score=49.23 TRINITY_DN36531_c0_g2_i1:105-1013(-)